MKTITIRLPEPLAAVLEAEAQERGLSKSDIVREKLQRAKGPVPAGSLAAIADLVGSVDRLPRDLSARKKAYLKATSYGRKHAR